MKRRDLLLSLAVSLSGAGGVSAVVAGRHAFAADPVASASAGRSGEYRILMLLPRPETAVERGFLEGLQALGVAVSVEIRQLDTDPSGFRNATGTGSQRDDLARDVMMAAPDLVYVDRPGLRDRLVWPDGAPLADSGAERESWHASPLRIVYITGRSDQPDSIPGSGPGPGTDRDQASGLAGSGTGVRNFVPFALQRPWFDLFWPPGRPGTLRSGPGDGQVTRRAPLSRLGLLCEASRLPEQMHYLQKQVAAGGCIPELVPLDIPEDSKALQALAAHLDSRLRNLGIQALWIPSPDLLKIDPDGNATASMALLPLAAALTARGWPVFAEQPEFVRQQAALMSIFQPAFSTGRQAALQAWQLLQQPDEEAVKGRLAPVPAPRILVNETIIKTLGLPFPALLAGRAAILS